MMKNMFILSNECIALVFFKNWGFFIPGLPQGKLIFHQIISPSLRKARMKKISINESVVGY